MKKVILVLPVVMALAACDGGVVDIQNNDLVQPSHEYEIDTWGANSEIYEFTPRGNSEYSCVSLMLDSGKAMGLECFPKKKSNPVIIPEE